jgi:hypothetical protein
LSGEWHARFEFVSGPYDGLTFTIAHDGVSLGSEIADLPPAQKPDLGDFDDVEFEVGREGVKLTCGGTFTLNGEQTTGTREMSQGDIAKIGASEVLLVECSTGAAQEDGGGGAAGPASPVCRNPDCGATNKPGAKWCAKCGWDLEGPD